MADQFSQFVDVPAVLFSIVWIVGFAIILASLSIQHYNAQRLEIPFLEQLRKPPFQLVLWIGLTLVSIGFAGIANSTWELIAWIALGALSLFQAIDPYQKFRGMDV